MVVMEIQRNIHLNRLISGRHNGMIKVVTGLRRCGKSYLLFNLFAKYLRNEGVDDAHIIKVNLEDRRNLALRDPDNLLAHIDSKLKDDQMHYILLDEVQFVSHFEDVLNSFLHVNNADVYVTGSNSRMLSKDIATNFRDRGFEIRLHPLTFAEYYKASGLEKSESFDRYLVWGGMPLAILERNDKDRAKYLKGLFEKVYLKDVRERNHLRNDHISECVLNELCSVVGSLTNPHKLVKALGSQGHVKVTDRTLKKYLDYFEDAFLFAKADRYDVRGKRHLEYPKKYYATDVGLRNARLNFRQIDEPHLMENVIYNELVARGYGVDVGVVELRRRKDGESTLSHLEIDFVVNTGMRKVYVQSAFRMADEEKRRQETDSLRASGDFFRKIVVVSGTRPPLSDDDGIEGKCHAPADIVGECRQRHPQKVPG